MIVVGIYIKDANTLEYNRVELFNDEKISVNSSIQNVNDISKTFTDFSQTFTVPASKQNNKIFRHWYENSNDNGFSTLVKADAYIEIDTIPFRSGKIQLESCNVKDGQPQDYSITFIGALGSLKDKFNGLFLKDLTLNTSYDFEYSATVVREKIVTTTVSADVMFPLISSSRYWNYGSTTDVENNINNINKPIRYNELFPALKLKPIFNMIETQFGINFDGTTEEPSTFLSDSRFTNAYLWLKNSETFVAKELQNIDFTTSGNLEDILGVTVNLIDNYYIANTQLDHYIIVNPTSGYTTIPYIIKKYVNGIETQSFNGVNQLIVLHKSFNVQANNEKISFKIETSQAVQFNFFITLQNTSIPLSKSAAMSTQITSPEILSPSLFFPEIKIEDFFSGLLKMFNLICYSKDGVNYTIKQIEEYYSNGNIIDITKYIKSDTINLNRVKTYKKINFQYEKSESLVNVGFNSANGIEYGSLFYDTNNDGDEYNIKLPFEDLNFNNLKDKLQVGYALKTDLQKYTPKPVILYDYNPTALTSLTGTDFWFNTSISGGTSTQHTSYKAFGQEYFDGTDTYSLNFNAQQSTLTNELISNSLYQQYYENYLANIFDSKARLIKVSGILPTSLLTTLKLNDRLIIRDKRYLINTFTTDLTTGEVQFELLTDFREAPDTSIVLNLDAGNTASYSGTGTLWTDLSIYGNNGTLINGPAFDSANDGSIVFDGVDDYVTTLLNSSANNTTNIIWYKWDGVNKATTLTYLGNSDSTGLGFYINNGTNTNTAGNKIGVLYGGAYYNALNSGTLYGTLVSGIYTQLTLTRDDSTTMLYQNGVFLGYTTRTPNASTSSLNLKLGSGGGGLLSFGGAVPLIQFYNRALSSTEILAKFNQTKGRYGL